MEHLAPVGPVYQAGTLSGNPLAMALGYKTVSILKEGDIYGQLEDRSRRLEEGIRENLKRQKRSCQLNRVGSMMSLFFSEKPVVDFTSAMNSDRELFIDYFKSMLGEGIYLAPSPFEASFLSASHSEEDIDETIEANGRCLREVFSD